MNVIVAASDNWGKLDGQIAELEKTIRRPGGETPANRKRLSVLYGQRDRRNADRTRTDTERRKFLESIRGTPEYHAAQERQRAEALRIHPPRPAERPADVLLKKGPDAYFKHKKAQKDWDQEKADRDRAAFVKQGKPASPARLPKVERLDTRPGESAKENAYRSIAYLRGIMPGLKRAGAMEQYRRALALIGDLGRFAQKLDIRERKEKEAQGPGFFDIDLSLKGIEKSTGNILAAPGAILRASSQGVADMFGLGTIDPDIWEKDDATRISGKIAASIPYLVPGVGPVMAATQVANNAAYAGQHGLKKTGEKLLDEVNPFAPGLLPEDRILRGVGLVTALVGGVKKGRDVGAFLMDESVAASAISRKTGRPYDQSLKLVRDVKGHLGKRGAAAHLRPQVVRSPLSPAKPSKALAAAEAKRRAYYDRPAWSRADLPDLVSEKGKQGFVDVLAQELKNGRQGLFGDPASVHESKILLTELIPKHIMDKINLIVKDEIVGMGGEFIAGNYHFEKGEVGIGRREVSYVKGSEGRSVARTLAHEFAHSLQHFMSVEDVRRIREQFEIEKADRDLMRKRGFDTEDSWNAPDEWWASCVENMLYGKTKSPWYDASSPLIQRLGRQSVHLVRSFLKSVVRFVKREKPDVAEAIYKDITKNFRFEVEPGANRPNKRYIERGTAKEKDKVYRPFDAGSPDLIRMLDGFDKPQKPGRT